MGCFQTFKDIVIPPLVSEKRISEWEEPRKRLREVRTGASSLAHFRGTVHWFRPQYQALFLIKAGHSKPIPMVFASIRLTISK